MLSTRSKRLGGLFLLLIALGIGRGVWVYLAAGATISAPAPPPSATAPLTPLLPARPSATPNPHATPFSALLASPAAPLTLFGTSPFQFPTATPLGATLAADCRRVFPVESVEAIHFGQTTTAQLQAAFGVPASVHGRPPTYRFVAERCVLEVSVGFREAQEAILHDYGTLGGSVSLAVEIGSVSFAVEIQTPLDGGFLAHQLRRRFLLRTAHGWML